jgi:senataxin
MALTTEQQTSHLSRLQQDVLSWDYFTMDDGQTRSDAARRRALRDVPKTFASVTEYLDVFEPLVLEECAAQIARGGDEEETRPAGHDASTIGAVFSSQRVDGFHVVQFILGEEQMAGFHDNDVILVSKTDPEEALPETGRDADDADADDDAKKTSSSQKTSTTHVPNVVDDPHGDPIEGLHDVHALGYVDGRDSRNMMRVRFYLPEPSSAFSVLGGAADRTATNRKDIKGGKGGKDGKDGNRKDRKDRAVQDGKSEGDFVRFRAVRNALASPKSAWYLTHLANMSTIAREWLALRAFPSLPFAHAILGGKVEVRGSKPKNGDETTNAEEHAPWELPEPLAAAMKRSYNGASFLFFAVFFFLFFSSSSRGAFVSNHAPTQHIRMGRSIFFFLVNRSRYRAGMSNS